MSMTSSAVGCEVEYELTDDVKPQWLNVIRAMQAACRRNQGYATVTVKVLVNRDGVPINWSEPRLEKIHPKTPMQDVLLDLTNAG
jgi:hypothetical protein